VVLWASWGSGGEDVTTFLSTMVARCINDVMLFK
jgi:hypothetical protein